MLYQCNAYSPVMSEYKSRIEFMGYPVRRKHLNHYNRNSVYTHRIGSQFFEIVLSRGREGEQVVARHIASVCLAREGIGESPYVRDTCEEIKED